MKSDEIKICVICKHKYHPDKRTAKRQKVCANLSCRTAYKQNYNKQWRQRPENIDYFKKRYPYLKAWLSRHQGYLKTYRSHNHGHDNPKPNDIQVKLTSYNNNMITIIDLLDDIQVELNHNINSKKDQFLHPTLLDIQV